MKKYCTNCGQYKVIPRSTHCMVVGGAILLVGAVMLILPFIGIPAMATGLIILIGSPFAKGTYCESCHKVIK